MFKDKRFRKIIWGMCIGFLVICALPILFTTMSWFGLDFKETGGIGDTLSGIMSPFIAVVAAVLTFLAFWVQFTFNEDQIKRFNEQDDHIEKQEKDLKIERFENRFFELLKLHRENVQEFEIVRYHSDDYSETDDNKLTGRRLFVSMVDELRLGYEAAHVANVILISERKNLAGFYSKKDLLTLAYMVFFDGIQDNSLKKYSNPIQSPKYRILGPKYDLLLKKFLEIIIDIRTRYSVKGSSIRYEYVLTNDSGSPEKQGYTLNFPKIKYIPFSGHNSRLGHYYRHLFQTVKFVLDQEDKIIEDKYQYVKIIRAQLSNYEQVLLYYNSISLFGKPWIDNKYLTDWRMIKNIPLYIADFGPDPKEVLGIKNSREQWLFEVDEVNNQAK